MIKFDSWQIPKKKKKRKKKKKDSCLKLANNWNDR